MYLCVRVMYVRLYVCMHVCYACNVPEEEP